MTAQTPGLNLPYPEPTDPVAEYPATAKIFAESVEAALGSASAGAPHWAFVQSSETVAMPGWDNGGVMVWRALDDMTGAPFHYSGRPNVPDPVDGVSMPPDTFYWRKNQTGRFRFTLTSRFITDEAVTHVQVSLETANVFNTTNSWPHLDIWPTDPWSSNEWSVSYTGFVMPPANPAAPHAFRVQMTPTGDAPATMFQAYDTMLFVEQLA